MQDLTTMALGIAGIAVLITVLNELIFKKSFNSEDQKYSIKINIVSLVQGLVWAALGTFLIEESFTGSSIVNLLIVGLLSAATATGYYEGTKSIKIARGKRDD